MASKDFTYHPDEGTEVLQPEKIDIGALAVLNKSEIDQQIATAKQYPRSIKQFLNEAIQLATLDEETAKECIYALPRDGKVIEGPSARFAEIMAYSWGNSRAGARVVGEDAEFVTSQGMFFDLEKNVAISYEVKRRITNKSGKRYSADMIGTTSNAASSIALRNAVLKGIPKAIWKQIYNAARNTVAGDFKTLVNRRENALQAFVIYGVTPEMIYRTLGVQGKEDIGLDHFVVLSGFLTALKEGESSVEDIFGNPDNNIRSEKARTATNATASNLVDKYKKEPAPSGQQVTSELEQLRANAQKQANETGKPVSFKFMGMTVTMDPEPAADPSAAPAEQGTAQPPAQTAEHSEYRDPETQSQPSPKSGRSQHRQRTQDLGLPGVFGKDGN